MLKPINRRKIKNLIILMVLFVTPLKAFTLQNYIVNYPYNVASYIMNSKSKIYPEQNSPNPDELGSHIEGDIVLPPEMHIQDFEREITPILWSDKKIPYTISADFCKLPFN